MADKKGGQKVIETTPIETPGDSHATQTELRDLAGATEPGMTGGLLEIRSRRDLVQALETAKKIEEAFEEVLHWKGFLTMEDPGAGELLGGLVRDSETHRRLVESMMKLVESSASPHEEARSAPIVIDGDDEVQFLQKLLEGEDMAYYVYSSILDALSSLDPQYVGGERNAAELRRVLGRLVSAERGHRNLVSRLLAARSPP